MRRRSKVGGEPAKARRGKAVTPKQRAAPKAVRGRSSSVAGQQTQVVQLTRERDEAREQQKATAEILRVIRTSPADVQPVFETIVRNAVSLCGSLYAHVFRFDGELLHVVASHNVAPNPWRHYADFLKAKYPMRPDSSQVSGRVLLKKSVVRLEDARADPDYDQRSARGGWRRVLGVPMLREGEPLGVIVVGWTEAGPIPKVQEELLKTFADQAVIAIENVRLFEAEQQGTRELRESLEQQTATSEVLKVISSSPGELESVFQAMLENAVRICEAKFGILFRSEGDALRAVALHDAPPAYAEERRRNPVIRPVPETVLGRALAMKQAVQIADIRDEPAPSVPGTTAAQLVTLAGARSVLAVPMLREHELIGAIVIYRQAVRPFTDKQIALLQNFAAQAVIAIENARLLNELRGRTQELTEALEQRTATSEVLGVISSSPGELTSVFDSILANALRLCDADTGHVLRAEAGALSIASMRGGRPEYAQSLRERGSWRPAPDSGPAQAMEQKKPVQIADLSQTSGYAAGWQSTVAAVELGGLRTVLDVPMIADEKAIGVIVIYRSVVRPFSDKQIAVVENFAKQAVIAIENARLLSELRQRTAEVVKLNQQLEKRVADQVGEIERMSRLRRFLPPQVADLIVASGTEKQLESHRREITALFCDLRGFTGFSESSDPEDVMALLREYHVAIGEIIIKYSGTLERFAGDGVMVIFNDPVPVENPALQAVLMALDMRTAIGRMIEKWRALGHDLGFGIGIGHGFATLGTIGFEGRFDYAAIGTVSNVASRLCDEAKPGQILISPRVRLAVEEAVTVEPVGEFALKGIRRPMMTYNVLETSPAKPN